MKESSNELYFDSAKYMQNKRTFEQVQAQLQILLDHLHPLNPKVVDTFKTEDLFDTIDHPQVFFKKLLLARLPADLLQSGLNEDRLLDLVTKPDTYDTAYSAFRKCHIQRAKWAEYYQIYKGDVITVAGTLEALKQQCYIRSEDPLAHEIKEYLLAEKRIIEELRSRSGASSLPMNIFRRQLYQNPIDLNPNWAKIAEPESLIKSEWV